VLHAAVVLALRELMKTFRWSRNLFVARRANQERAKVPEKSQRAKVERKLMAHPVHVQSHFLYCRLIQ